MFRRCLFSRICDELCLMCQGCDELCLVSSLECLEHVFRSECVECVECGESHSTHSTHSSRMQIASCCRHTTGKVHYGHASPWTCLDSSFLWVCACFLLMRIVQYVWIFMFITSILFLDIWLLYSSSFLLLLRRTNRGSLSKIGLKISPRATIRITLVRSNGRAAASGWSPPPPRAAKQANRQGMCMRETEAIVGKAPLLGTRTQPWKFTSRVGWHDVEKNMQDSWKRSDIRNRMSETSNLTKSDVWDVRFLFAVQTWMSGRQNPYARLLWRAVGCM